MRYRLVFPLLLLSCSMFAQVDSLKLPSVSLDSLLHPYTGKLDSLQSSFYAHADSIKQSYQSKRVALEASKSKLQASVDSLTNLQLPTEKLNAKIDSLNQKQAEMLASLDQKISDLKSKTIGRINDLELPDQLQSKVSDLTKNIDGFKLPVKDFNIPSLSMPDSPLSNLNGLTSSMPSLENLKGLSGVSLPSELGNVGQVTEQISGYSQDVQQLAKGNLDQVQQIPQALETKAGELAGIDKIQEQAKVLDPMMDAAKNPEAMKEQAIEIVQQQAIDHFAGKEQVLQGAMEKLSKLKQKYSSLNSLSEIPKKRPNEMKGKPLIERIVPGIGIQLLKKNDDFLSDFNPYFGYRFTGRLTGGMGWNQRVPYNFDKGIYNDKAVVFGPRLFSEYRIGRGFSPRVEIEIMNMYVPTMTNNSPPEIQTRQWVFGAFVGVKREYQFVKNVRGTALVMLRVFNHMPHSPYGDVINVRFGFEFPMKKKVKQP